MMLKKKRQDGENLSIMEKNILEKIKKNEFEWIPEKITRGLTEGQDEIVDKKEDKDKNSNNQEILELLNEINARVFSHFIFLNTK